MIGTTHSYQISCTFFADQTFHHCVFPIIIIIIQAGRSLDLAALSVMARDLQLMPALISRPHLTEAFRLYDPHHDLNDMPNDLTS